MTRFTCYKDFPKHFIPFSRLKPMDESISAAKTSTMSRKRRGKYCAAFGCDNSAYDANGVRTSYHFFEFPRDAHRRNRWCTLIKRQHGHDGFVVSTSTVLCHEHFRDEDITKKTFWSLTFEKRFVIFFSFSYAFVMFTSQHCSVRFCFWLFQTTKAQDISVFINQSSYITSDHRLCK